MKLFTINDSFAPSAWFGETQAGLVGGFGRVRAQTKQQTEKRMKQVRETSAGKSIGAWVILKGKREVATVQAYYGNRVLVNVFNYGDKNKTAAKGLHFQAGSAGGYGYDKFTAALSGLEIDGHKLTNHCGARLKGNLFPIGSPTSKRGNGAGTSGLICHRKNKVTPIAIGFRAWTT